MACHKRFLLIVLSLLAMSILSPVSAEQATASTIRVSGTISGPSGTVPGVWIGVSSDQDWQEDTTDSNGFYSVSILTDGELRFHVRPEASLRLTHINLRIKQVTADVTQDFTLTAGNLLELRVLDESGMPVQQGLWVGAQPVFNEPVEEQWHDLVWDGSELHWAVLPADVYYLTVAEPPSGYYATTTVVDLRSGDRSVDLSLNTGYVHPIPYDPPDAAKITVGAVDDLGEATVTGAPGAALPLSYVLLVNLNSTHQTHTISDADGSFSARIYAPPGSAIMIKHGTPDWRCDWRWNDLDVGVAEGVNPFPGTIINVPHSQTGDEHELPFASAGAIAYSIDDSADTLNYVGSAWAMTGVVSPVIVEGEWTRVLTGTYDSEVVPGLYLGGLNYTHPCFGDLDGDGDLDLLVGAAGGDLILYDNLGTSSSPDWSYAASEFAGIDCDWWVYPALADVNDDGALDLVVGIDEGTVSIYHNAGTSSAPSWNSAPDSSLGVGPSPAPALTDLDGDGDLDLLVGGPAGSLYHFENTGTSQNPTWTSRTSAYGAVSEPDELQPAFLDLDGDGDLDLLLGRCGSLVWYRREGSPSSPTWLRVDSDPIGYGGGSCRTSAGIGDWDGDGDDDVVTGEHWGVMRFYRQLSPGSWQRRDFSLPFDLEGDSAPALADWDDDGDPDLLIGQAHGRVHKYSNSGGAAAPDWRQEGVLVELPWTNHPHAFPTFADIDGDDDYDLFIGEGGWQSDEGAGGNIHYYLNDGTPSAPDWQLITHKYLDLDVGGWSTPVFVDINADGDLDLFVGDENGTLTFVENLGTSQSPDWADPEPSYAELDIGRRSVPAFMDLDQDDDLDMLVGTQQGSLAYVRNTGTADSPDWELVSTAYPGIDVGEASVPIAADIDGDGDQDLLIGDGDGGLNLYLYEGPGTPPADSSSYAPGDLLQIEGSLRVYSPAIDDTTDVEAVSAQSWLSMLMLFDERGNPMAAENYFMSSILTPGGFPIQRVERAYVGLGARLQAEDFRRLGEHELEADFSVTARIPDNALPGIYRPTFHMQFDAVPGSTDWLAANVTQYTYGAEQAVLPPLTIRSNPEAPPLEPRLNWRLLMDDFVQGTRGTGAREDHGKLEVASQIVTQGAPFAIPPVASRTGQLITYRLEPFMPRISFTDRRIPGAPLIPFDLPGGQLSVTVQAPDGFVRDLGSAPFTQSFNRTKTTRGGTDLNSGTVQLEDVYSLTTGSDAFRVTFDQYGHHVISMTGSVSDLWGNTYSGGGTYDIWIAHPLDIDPAVLPGTPLATGEGFNATVQVYPRVPADVSVQLTAYPDSDLARADSHVAAGQANSYGYFCLDGSPITPAAPGEYRVDVIAMYTDTASGEMYTGATTWGGVVMTPENEAHLVAKGRRGLDSLQSIPTHWFVSGRDLDIPEGAVSHSLNPYHNGDILWSRMSDGPYGGDSLIMGASVLDLVGVVQSAVRTRANRVSPALASPGSLDERFSAGEIPLFISTRSGREAQMVLDQVGGSVDADVDQIAYSYRSSQRPGVRVREVVAEDGQSGGYWRLDTLYDDQLGVGVLGDQPNDFKFQYVGVVYRDLDSGQSEYLGQGSGWIFIPDSDPLGSRAKPPFAGPGNGGWDAEGGPILTLKGEDVHIFILPTGVRAGAVLEVGDTFSFSGHIMPTLASQVAVTATAPGGTQHLGGGQASHVGYFYDPEDDFVLDEPGLWSVDVNVWHDGQCSGGSTIQPYPSGNVLGSESGRHWFYVVPEDSPRLRVTSPSPGFLSFGREVSAISIGGSIPPHLTDAVVDYTISMPGYILQHGQATIAHGGYTIVFDPVALQHDFPNLDLMGRDDSRPGLADTFAIGLLLQARDGSETVYRANTVTLQGEQVFVSNDPVIQSEAVLLPLVMHD